MVSVFTVIGAALGVLQLVLGWLRPSASRNAPLVITSWHLRASELAGYLPTSVTLSIEATRGPAKNIRFGIAFRGVKVPFRSRSHGYSPR